LFDYLNKNLIYDVRSTIYDFKSEIRNRKYGIIYIRYMSWLCSYRSRRNCPERRCRFRCLLQTSQTQKISCGYGRSGRMGKITFSVPLRSENIRQILCCTDYIRIRISALYLSSNIITTHLTAKTLSRQGGVSPPSLSQNRT